MAWLNIFKYLCLVLHCFLSRNCFLKKVQVAALEVGVRSLASPQHNYTNMAAVESDVMQLETPVMAAAAAAAPAAPAAAGAADAPMDGAAKPKRPAFIKANSTSTVFAQCSLTDPDVDELILRYSRVTFSFSVFES
jgi:hypothetical protein